jgi:hypothetical protein
VIADAYKSGMNLECRSLTKRKKRGSEAGKAKYQVTDQEKAVLRAHIARLKDAPVAPAIKLTKDEKATQIGLHHPNSTVGYGLLMEALGTADYSFGNDLLKQLVNASLQRGEANEASFNFMLSVIIGIKPRDHLEAMLAAQMAAIHMATMTFTRRLAHVENIPQQDSAERALNKLARTYAGQMETLKRYRTGGEQKVTVQHVSVSEGGQAIVGNVNQAPPARAPGKQRTNPPPVITDARSAPMPVIEESKERVPARLCRARKRSDRES